MASPRNASSRRVPHPGSLVPSWKLLLNFVLLVLLALLAEHVHAATTSDDKTSGTEERIADLGARFGWGELTPPELDRIARSVRSIMERRLSLPLIKPVDVRLSHERSLRVRTPERGLVGEETGAIGKFRNADGRYEVWIVSRVSPRKAVRVLAHELGHAYYEENYHRFKDREFREGFAEWVAYRVLAEMGLEREMSAMRRRHDLYGQGLRRMLEAEREGGLARVIEVAMR